MNDMRRGIRSRADVKLAAEAAFILAAREKSAFHLRRASGGGRRCECILPAFASARFSKCRRRFSLPRSDRVTARRARIPSLPKLVAFPLQARAATRSD